MDAFLFYVDDWLSSKRVNEMDAHEERGYLRLLLHAAKEPDCGLPDDPKRLALMSKLGAQWNRPTRDKKFRFGATSVEKLLACFEIKKNGRIYNERLLQVFNKHKDVVEARQKAARAKYAMRVRLSMQSQPNLQTFCRVICTCKMACKILLPNI